MTLTTGIVLPVLADIAPLIVVVNGEAPGNIGTS